MWTPLPLSECPVCKVVAWDRRRPECWACATARSPKPAPPGTHVMVACSDHRLHPAVVVEERASERLVAFEDGTQATRRDAHVAVDIPAEVTIAPSSMSPAPDGSASGHSQRPRRTQMVSQFGASDLDGVEGSIAELRGAFELTARTAPPDPSLDRYIAVEIRIERGAVRVIAPRPDGRATIVLARPGRPCCFSEPVVSGPDAVVLMLEAVGGDAHGIRYVIDFHSGTRIAPSS